MNVLLKGVDTNSTGSVLNTGDLMNAIGLRSPVFSMSERAVGVFIQVEAQQGSSAASEATRVAIKSACTGQGDPVLTAGQLESLIGTAQEVDLQALNEIVPPGN